MIRAKAWSKMSLISSRPCWLWFHTLTEAKRITVLLLLLNALALIKAVRVKCNRFRCEVYDLSSQQDTFVYSYLPKNVPTVVHRYVRLEELPRAILQQMPKANPMVRIEDSDAVKRINVPRAVEGLAVELRNLAKLELEKDSILRELRIRHAKLTEVPATLANAPLLDTVELYNSRIRELDLVAFCDHALLDVISLKRNHIRHVKNTANKHCPSYDSVTKISLVKNNIKRLDIAIFNPFVKLKELDLQNSKIVTVSDRFVNSAIGSLFLSDNILTALNVCHWHLPRVQMLVIQGTSLSVVPACLERLGNVTTIDLSENKLFSFTIDSIAPMDNLYALMLGRNQLTSVVLNSPKFPKNLGTISLAHNRLTRLDLSFIPVPFLSVDISANNFTVFDVASVSGNVTSLYMHLNPVECSWNTPVERELVQCTYPNAPNKSIE